MRLYSLSDAIPAIDYYQGQEKSDLVADALGRMYSADNCLSALQIGLREIVYLTGAKWGVLLTHSPDGRDLQPLVVCEVGSKQLYELLESADALGRSTVDDSPASISAGAGLFSSISLKSFGKVVGVIQIDPINYLGHLTEQKRVAVEILIHQLGLLVERLELSQVAQDRQTLLEMLTTANQVGQRLNAHFNAQQTLTEFSDSSRFLFNAERCFILAVNWDTETLQLWGDHQPDLLGDNLPEVGLDDTILGRVVQTGEPLLVAEVGADERYNYYPLKRIFGLEIQQLMAVPLSVRGEVLGVIGIVNKNGDYFDELDLSLLQILAPSISIALENVHRFAWQQVEAAQKAELYSVASHALRSPMMNILASVELILETGVRNKLHRTRLEDIRSQIFSLARFAGAILDLSRIESENLRTQLIPVALTPLINKTLAAFERRFPAYHFEMQTLGNIPLAFADEAQLVIILDHLVENAVKYSPSNSTVRIKVATSGHQVVISVCDQGNGIPPDELDNIFGRYYRGRHQPAAGHSLGLGLYIVRKLVQAQGGEIWVESNVGHGSCFTFFLLQAEIGD